MKNIKALSFGLLVLAPGAFAQSFISFNGVVYNESFDSFTPTGTNTFSNTGTDLSTLTGTSGFQGWYATRALAGTSPVNQGDGSSNAGALYSFGTTAAADRALGSLSSGTPSTINFGARIRNTSGNNLSSSLVVKFDGEQWRNGGNTATQKLTFSWKKQSAASWNVLDLNTGTGFTNETALDFSSVQNTATAAALNGNLAANRTAGITATINLGSQFLNGEEVIIRWTDLNDTGNDHGLGIDNLQVVPEPASLAVLGLGAAALIRRRKRA